MRKYEYAELVNNSSIRSTSTREKGQLSEGDLNESESASCSTNLQCNITKCCYNGKCGSTNLCGKTTYPINHTQILCVMGVIVFILIGIFFYIWSIRKKQCIKSSGPYLGKHTYLSRKTYLPPERLVPPFSIKLKGAKKSIIKENPPSFGKHFSGGMVHV